MDRYDHLFVWCDTGEPINYGVSLIDEDYCKYCNKTVYEMSGEERVAAQKRSGFELIVNKKFPCLTKNEYVIKQALE